MWQGAGPSLRHGWLRRGRVDRGPRDTRPRACRGMLGTLSSVLSGHIPPLSRALLSTIVAHPTGVQQVVQAAVVRVRTVTQVVCEASRRILLPSSFCHRAMLAPGRRDLHDKLPSMLLRRYHGVRTGLQRRLPGPVCAAQALGAF